VPSSPQVAAVCFWQSAEARGIAPATRLRHVPGEPAAEQVKQPPAQALSQQTFSTQNPLLHWALQPQVAPWACGVPLARQASGDPPPSVLELPSGAPSRDEPPSLFGVVALWLLHEPSTPSATTTAASATRRSSTQVEPVE
jgi:hypothetical protein